MEVRNGKWVTLLVLQTLAACGGGGGGSAPSPQPGSPAAPAAPAPSAPSNLVYGPSTVTVNVLQAMSPLTPAVTGATMSYSVSPSLPRGITLDPNTGEIRGTGRESRASASYTISATNAVGSTQFILNLSVVSTLAAP